MGALISSIVISEAVHMGVPKSVLLKMAFNIALDVLVGAVPVLGDIFDFVWKSNQRNVVLLNDYLEHPRETLVTSRLFAWGLGAVLAVFAIVVGTLGFALVRALLNAGGV